MEKDDMYCVIGCGYSSVNHVYNETCIQSISERYLV